MISGVVDLFSHHNDIMRDAVFATVPHLRHDARIVNATFETMGMIYRTPPDALVVETLTHTARWVTMQVEPEVLVLDQTQRWQDEVKCLMGDHRAACPFGVAAIQHSNSRLHFILILAEVLDVDRDNLALAFHGHYTSTVVRAEVRHDIVTTYPLITLRHD